MTQFQSGHRVNRGKLFVSAIIFNVPSNAETTAASQWLVLQKKTFPSPFVMSYKSAYTTAQETFCDIVV